MVGLYLDLLRTTLNVRVGEGVPVRQIQAGFSALGCMIDMMTFVLFGPQNGPTLSDKGQKPFPVPANISRLLTLPIATTSGGLVKEKVQMYTGSHSFHRGLVYTAKQHYTTVAQVNNFDSFIFGIGNNIILFLLTPV